jgi:catechol 2,3-dioxygenase-like lactoylglutathione lyase family enzyme
MEWDMAGLGNITFYADDPAALARFWTAVFGYPPMEWEDPIRQQLLDAGLTEEDLDKRGLAEDPAGVGPRLFFHHADTPKAGRNRLHLDISATPGRAPTPDELDAEKDRLVGLGAEVVRLVDQSWGPWPEHYYQMRDPEGNEFCLQ